MSFERHRDQRTDKKIYMSQVKPTASQVFQGLGLVIVA